MKAEINKFLTYEDVIRKNTEELKIKTDEIVNLQRRLEELTSQVELLFTGNTEAQKTIVEQGLEIENQKVQYKEQERFINLLSDRLTALKEDLQTALNKALAGHNGWELVKIGLKKIFIG
jgi:predicted nuclease with TOPRIM domain